MNYQERKARARAEAIDYQLDYMRNNCSLDEIIEKTTYFEKLGKRYGLTKEFKENGII